MARSAKTTTTPAEDGFNPQRLEEAGEAAKQLSTLQHGYNQGRDLVNQLLGQAQAFQAAGNLLQTFGVSKLAIVKENKLYQQIAGMHTPNGLELKGTWVEFCSLLGTSDEKANQDIANLQAFGEEALEQMQRIGIGYRDMRQFRKLPTDQKTALIEAAKTGDKDTLMELAEDLIAKHAKEKESAQVELDTKTALLAKEKLHSERLAKDNDDLHTKLARVKTVKPDQVMKELKQVLSGFALDIEATAVNRLEPAVAALAAHAEANGGDIAPFINSEIGRLETVLRDLRQQFVGASEADVAAWNR